MGGTRPLAEAKMKARALIFLAGLSLVATASAAHSASPKCSHEDGFIEGPLVPDHKTAEAIFRAVISARFPRSLSSYPIIKVADNGGSWTVYSTATPVKSIPGEVVVEMGGGMSMAIEKCTGAISKLQGMR
jgi:hypothetical protein